MKQLAIFASGSGTNAENIVRLFHQGSRVRVAVALCNRKECGVYQRLEALGVPVIYMPSSAWENDPERIVETLRPYNIDMIVLAGFLRRVRPEIIDSVKGNVLNIHPSLLPAYGGKGMYGSRVHEAVIAAGEKKSGVTVHYVTDDIDGGEIILQEEVDVLPGDTPDSLAARIHKVEYSIFPRAIVKALAKTEDHPRPPVIPTPEIPHPSQAGTSDKAGHNESPTAVPPTPTTPASPDEQWARALHINNYSDAGAEQARAQANTHATPPAPATPATPVNPATPINPAAPASPAGPVKVNVSGRHPSIAQAAARGVEIPKSYLWVSIVMAVIFSTIPGIIAIVFSAMVNSRLSCGDLKGAAKASRTAQIWIIVAFVLGVLSATVWVPISMMAGI